MSYNSLNNSTDIQDKFQTFIKKELPILIIAQLFSLTLSIREVHFFLELLFYFRLYKQVIKPSCIHYSVSRLWLTHSTTIIVYFYLLGIVVFISKILPDSIINDEFSQYVFNRVLWSSMIIPFTIFTHKYHAVQYKKEQEGSTISKLELGFVISGILFPIIAILGLLLLLAQMFPNGIDA